MANGRDFSNHAQTLNMFFGESCCLLVFYANLLWAARKNAGIAIEDDDSAIAGGDHEDDAIPTPTLARPGLPMTGWKNLLLWIPTLCKSLSCV